MKSRLETIQKIYCKYFEKALCLRDNVNMCEVCPYYKLVEDSKSEDAASRE
jgi:hypothetical protein